MKKKGNFRKVVSGLLAGMTMLSTVLSPMTAYAAEIQPEEKPPLYEEVKDLLDEDEVVTAKDYEIETGSVFDVKSDYTGLEIKDDNKVKVTFEEAKNDKDEDFTTDHADTYKAVYYVEPVNQEHPKYQISRKLIVREKATEAQTETAGSEAVTESETAGSEQQTEEAEDSEADSEITDIDADEFDDLVEQAQNQDTYDEESGLELHDVLEQAGDEGVDLDAMEEGEIATFEAVSAYSARSTQQVTIEKGPLYRYADYNLGTYLTEPYYISYGNVRAIAYCVQPAKPGPGSGNYTITKIGDNQALAKVCYYGTDAAGSESFFANKRFRSGQKVDNLQRVKRADSLQNLVKIREQTLNYLLNLLLGKDTRTGSSSLSDLYGTDQTSGGQYSAEFYYEENETTSFSTDGVVKTSDGREISFNVELTMSRSFTQYTSQTIDFGSPRFMDPLVINLDAPAADVKDQKFLFDLDADGHEEAISRLGAGSGFLALDKNGDGQINDGSELFGALNGDGFADLAKYDNDGNGWIDEADEIFDKLLIWSKDANGNDQLVGLGKAGVGAIYLGAQNTQFSMNNAYNEANAMVRQTGMFLYENGGVGTIQQLDLAT